MAGLVLDGANPDVSLLYDVNGLAKSAPSWFDRVMGFVGEYGVLAALVVLVLGCWWCVRRRGTRQDSVSAVAGLLWAPLSAGVAVLINMPIRGFVRRPRPFLDHRTLDVLVRNSGHDYSFVSDDATLAMALAVGLFVVHRRIGFAALALAVLEGFVGVFEGVHYPTDVVGGFALGTAVVLLLTPLATALLTPLVSAVADSRVGRLVRSRHASGGKDGDGGDDGSEAGPYDRPGSGAGARDLDLTEHAPGDSNLAA
jgi:undecaprenyl-diphosphatase